jgi:hypothetical protein
MLDVDPLGNDTVHLRMNVVRDARHGSARHTNLSF